MEFKLTRLILEITVSKYNDDCSQQSLNPNVEITIAPNNTRITIACDNFRSFMQTKDLFYQRDIRKADELKLLVSIKACLNEMSINALSWAFQSKEASLNRSQFFVPVSTQKYCEKIKIAIVNSNLQDHICQSETISEKIKDLERKQTVIKAQIDELEDYLTDKIVPCYKKEEKQEIEKVHDEIDSLEDTQDNLKTQLKLLHEGHSHSVKLEKQEAIFMQQMHEQLCQWQIKEELCSNLECVKSN